MMRLKSYFVLMVLTATAYACGTGSKPRVFFVEPQNGATVKSPVHLKFGIENYQIAAVPQGTVDTARQGMGHYHVAVDSDCLSAGTVIQKAMLRPFLPEILKLTCSCRPGCTS